MGRVQSKGLEFFDLAVTFDDKIECLILIHGNDGLAFMIRFWQMAYKSDKGEVDSSCILHRSILKKQINVDDEKLDCIICDAIKLGLIDNAVFKKRQMLTSNGIKRRIARIAQLREKARERFTRKAQNTSTKNGRSNEEEKRKQDSKIHRSDQIRSLDQIRVKKRERETTNDLESVESVTPKTQPLSRSFSPPSGDNIFSEADVLKLREQLGNDQAGFWIEEVKLAYERNPNDFAKKYNSVVAVAVSWCRKCLSEGKVWDATSKTYTKPIKKQTESKSAESLAAGALAILEKQEQRKNKELQ